MKALCGQLPVVQGEIVYHFCPEGAAPQHHIAYVSFEGQKAVLGVQDPFYQARWNSTRSQDGLCVADYLWPPARRQPGASVPPADQAHVWDEVADLMQIGGLLERNTVQLSSGERRKLAIAKALLQTPRLLIVDNPFTGLDERSSRGLRAAIGRLTQGALTGGEGQRAMRVIVVATDRDPIPPGITHTLRVSGGQVAGQQPVERERSGEDASSARTWPSAAPVRAPRPTGAAPVLVQMEDVRVAYDGTKVLKGIDWTVREGEHWALVGPNGAGKTTLLSLILADHPQAYANRIVLFGRPRGSGESIWDIKRQVGWVAPELHLYYPPGASAHQVVCSGYHDSVGLYQRCTPAQQAEALEWMGRLGIAASAERPFARLSEGEQRMALIARALVKQPKLLVLDEPCQGLDAANRDRVLCAIAALGCRADASTIYVTHRDDELPSIITHILRLQDGAVVDQQPASAPDRPPTMSKLEVV